jgi:hypothetical protein
MTMLTTMIFIVIARAKIMNTKKTRKSDDVYLKITKCPICGKEFAHYDEWYWKIGNWGFETRDKYVCSYSCMRVWEKAQEERIKNK